MDTLSVPVIQSALSTRFVGRRLLYYPVVESTNEVARVEGRAGAPEGTVVLADEQKAGRGRLGRRWVAPPGSSLLLSVIFRPSILDLPRLTMVAAVAVARAVEAVAGLSTSLKWHNDVLVGDRKVCGILVEGELRGGGVSFAVVGIGLNVNFDPSIIPEIATTATSLQKGVGHEVSRVSLLARLLTEIEELYLAQRQGIPVQTEWRERLGTLGQQVRVTWGDSVEEGVAEAVDEEGRLLVRRPDGSLATIVAGDVTLRTGSSPR